MTTGALELRTDRLRLRRWRDSDYPAFAAMNADPRVMAYFPAPLSREESDALAARIAVDLDRRRFGLWAVEIDRVTPFAGFIGLSVPALAAHFTPCVEIGWRLAASHWGRGYATERGARRSLVARSIRSASRNRVVHDGGEHTIAPRDGAHRHDAR